MNPKHVEMDPTMSNSENPREAQQAAGEDTQTQAPETSAPAATTSTEPGPPPAAEANAPEQARIQLEEQVKEARAETNRVKDQMLRLAADFDNYRKRSSREVADGSARAREDLLKELLPVFDNLERALSHADQAPDGKSVAQGVRMILRQFQDTLGKLGVSRVPTVGSPFNPRMHEAVQQMASKDHPPETVITELQPGYTWGERLVRPATVIVSKAPEEDAPADSEAAQ